MCIVSALTHSPGFFDFIGDLARQIAPLATVVAPFFPPAAAIAGIAGAIGAVTSPGFQSAAGTLVQGPAQAVGSTWPSVPAAAGLEGAAADVEPFDIESLEGDDIESLEGDNNTSDEVSL